MAVEISEEAGRYGGTMVLVRDNGEEMGALELSDDLQVELVKFLVNKANAEPEAKAEVEAGGDLAARQAGGGMVPADEHAERCVEAIGLIARRARIPESMAVRMLTEQNGGGRVGFSAVNWTARDIKDIAPFVSDEQATQCINSVRETVTGNPDDVTHRVLQALVRAWLVANAPEHHERLGVAPAPLVDHQPGMQP